MRVIESDFIPAFSSKDGFVYRVHTEAPDLILNFSPSGFSHSFLFARGSSSSLHGHPGMPHDGLDPHSILGMRVKRASPCCAAPIMSRYESTRVICTECQLEVMKGNYGEELLVEAEVKDERFALYKETSLRMLDGWISEQLGVLESVLELESVWTVLAEESSRVGGLYRRLNGDLPSYHAVQAIVAAQPKTRATPIQPGHEHVTRCSRRDSIVQDGEASFSAFATPFGAPINRALEQARDGLTTYRSLRNVRRLRRDLVSNTYAGDLYYEVHPNAEPRYLF